MAVSVRAPRLRRIAAMVAALIVLPTLFAAPVSAANNIKFSMFLDDCSLYAYDAPANTNVRLEWRAADGSLKLKQTVTSNSSGDVWSDCEDELEIGDVLKATVSGSTRQVTAPLLKLTVDRDNEQIWGRSEPGSALDVGLLTRQNSFNYEDGVWYSEVVHADSSGGFAWDVGALYSEDIRRSDYAWVSWTSPAGHSFGISTSAPSVRLSIGRAWLTISGNAGSQESVSLLDAPAGTELAETGGTLNDGFDRFRLFDSDGIPRRVQPGNYVESTVGFDAAFTVPNITVTINKTTAKVTANCGQLAVRGVGVDTRSRNYSRYGSREGRTNGSGVFVANFGVAPKTAIRSGDFVSVTCMVASGDTVSRTFPVP